MRTTRGRTGRWVVLSLAAITAVALLGAWLTAPRLGGRMDPGSTAPLGTHALVALLRDRGVDVVVADTVEDVAGAAQPDTLVLIAETFYLRDEAMLRALADVPGDRLILEPTAKARQALAPQIRLNAGTAATPEPECDVREANRAGVVNMQGADTYESSGNVPVIRCYGGALVRYQFDGRTVTVVGASDFLTNGGLLTQGNAALAMNLAGDRPRLIWFAPQRMLGDGSTGATLGELIPEAFIWVVIQLCVVVALLAVWRGRRLGPLVAERLPVVVRASETVEGRARLYRSRRARGQAAAALRTAALQRMTPRLGLGPSPSPQAVIAAATEHGLTEPGALGHILFGPPPASDSELFELAQALDDIERQVRQS